MARIELFGTASCPYTQEMREWLEWRRTEFVKYNVEGDPSSPRASALPLLTVKVLFRVLVKDGRVVPGRLARPLLYRAVMQ